ncbi:MAG TPA: hypothetical protein VFN10_14225 [Thermoanaerobaculia bacterium]|nr:hypothetical protein [Thermoanaerobaculia bacterium]
MTKLLRSTCFSLVLLAPAAFAAPLFSSATESKWSVSKGTAAAGTITLLTSSNGVRAEWRGTAAKSPVVIFLGSKDNKIYVRQPGGDVELAAYKGGAESSIVPALVFTDAKATYKKDAKGASEVTVNGYTATRTSFGTSNADAANFTINPKKGASSRLARLSGDLLGTSQGTVSATAGTRGAGTKGLKLADGGDYGAVEKVENRDAKWLTKMPDALAEFQKDGKIGKAREDQ